MHALKNTKKWKVNMNYKEAYEQVKKGSWSEFFHTQDLNHFMDALDNETKTIYPTAQDIFKVFELAPKDIKVVILGQDPYYNPGQANGLAFSVNPNTSTPRSLKNIFKELKDDLGIERTNADLSDWHEEGVFLLNTALSVPEKEPNKHKKEWKKFTDELLMYLTKTNPDILYLMWGKNAEEHGFTIADRLPHDKKVIHYSAHPSPLSASRGFFNSKPFSWVNEKLREQGKPEIKW